jgi:nucleotide-binding universal stress UspA family protein
VLVVNRRPRELRRLVIGVDGSANARRAVAFIAELPPPPGAMVTVVGALEATGLLPHQLLPAAMHRSVRRELATLTDDLSVSARRQIDDAAATLREAGWRVRTVLRTGRALEVLLAAVQSTGADLLVIGARGVTTLDALLVGSVAEGALTHCRVPVLLVR